MEGFFIQEGIIVNAAAAQDTVKLILIDSSHSGMDGGTVYRNGTLEKNINLSISLMLRNKLIRHSVIKGFK